ncbi:MAG: hypothetical protein AVDCRST_MAG13-2383, partial [uncultured Solirubrobacteraceae bacterium]
DAAALAAVVRRRHPVGRAGLARADPAGNRRGRRALAGPRGGRGRPPGAGRSAARCARGRGGAARDA